MQISRRDALMGATAAAVVTGATVVPLAIKAAGVKAALADAEEEQMLAVLRLLPDKRRALLHTLMRQFAGLPEDPELARRWSDDPSRPNGEAGS